MIGPGDVEAAWRLIQPHVRRTPALDLPAGMFGISSTLALKLDGFLQGRDEELRTALRLLGR